MSTVTHRSEESSSTLARTKVWLQRQPEIRIAIVLFVLVTGVAFIARFYGIDAMPFWLDEVTTVQRASLPFWDMVTDSLANHHLPSYFALAGAFGRFGSMTEFVLRLPSAFFGAASCGVLFLIGRELGGWRAGLVAGMLLALSPLQVQYGQEARSYTFVILMMAIGLLGFVQLARDSRAASLPWGMPGARLAPWVIYTLGTLGALNVLSTGFFWLISANLAVIAILLRDHEIDRGRFLRRWLLAQGIVLLFTLPWFGAMDVFTHGEMTNATNWVPQITWHSFYSVLGSLYLMRVTRLINFHVFPAAVPGFGVLVVVLGVLGLLYLRRLRAGWGSGPRSRSLIPALVIAAAVPPLLILLISIVKPLWMPRYLIWSTVPFLIFVGLGINYLPARFRNGAVVAVLLLAVANLVPYYNAETKPRWDLAARVLTRDMKPGDMILISDELPVYMMNFFLSRRGEVIPASNWTTDVFRAAKHLQDGGRVWVMFGRVGQADRTPVPSFARIVKPLGAPVADVQVGDLIHMKLYARPPEAAPVVASAADCNDGAKEKAGKEVPAGCDALALQ
ncbi:MAG TPA: glycosyltransferase family 39 protein [Acidisoma sp.]|uniref:glycosyltransferase family 39 protein n=1 Tax=Acidisoma sp. TaxID=1872115 RepID=UPI002C5249D5|nr:glycosyltransferase family 39 protein [Acidisoma sp.]HTI02670.1 glycosyltransferase family 39 protein [Acidisoma sp.]